MKILFPTVINHHHQYLWHNVSRNNIFFPLPSWESFADCVECHWMADKLMRLPSLPPLILPPSLISVIQQALHVATLSTRRIMGEMAFNHKTKSRWLPLCFKKIFNFPSPFYGMRLAIKEQSQELFCYLV